MTAQHFFRARRPAFTLIEVALAAAIGSIVLLAAMSLVMTLERTQRSVSKRANETAQLQRARLVLERAFGTILVSPPAPQRTAVATAVPADQSGGTPAPGNMPKEGSSSVLRELSANDRGRRAPGEAPDRGPGTRSTGSDKGGEGKQGATDPAAPPQPAVRAPDDAPPRIILHRDDLVSQYAMTIKEVDGTLSRVVPQRLEMVLIEPPVPTQQPDAFVIARAVRLEAKRRGFSHEPPEEEAAPEDATLAGEQPIEGDGEGEASEEWGIRAVRGAFELIPKEGKDKRILLDDEGNPKAWELWWVPLAPRYTIEEVRDMGRARAVLEASSYGEPFRVATDLAACRIRMFDDRTRKDEFQATIQNQLPAYAEVDISTVSGLSATWLLEVSWATGPETRPRVEEDASGNDIVGGRRVENLPGDTKGNQPAPNTAPNTAPSTAPNTNPSTTPPVRTPTGRGRYRVQPAVPIVPKDTR